MKKILTVIIPTYNVEKYLDQCLKSMVIDDYMELLEILVINDGSVDSSPEIARKYVEVFPDTFKLINKENGGHGSTINVGIQMAKGKYLKVIDSDDWVDESAFKRLIDFLLKTDSDLVYSNYYWVDSNTGKKRIEFPEPFINVEYNKEYNFSVIPEGCFLKMHGYTLKTEIAKQIPPIDENCFYVDMEFVVFPVLYIETVTFLNEFVYMYRVGNTGQSMSSSKLMRNAENYDIVFKRLLAFYQNFEFPYYKKAYIESVMARMVATRIKIFLCFPYDRKIENKISKFDLTIKKKFPDIYGKVKNRAVKILRLTHYKMYIFARFAYYCKERFV